MARPDQEAIETFMSITGVMKRRYSEIGVHKLNDYFFLKLVEKMEHRGNLNEAINAHFSEGDRSIAQGTSFAAPQDDVMDIDDPIPVESRRPSSLPPFARDLNPFTLLDPNFTRSIFDSGTGIASRPPFVSHPRAVREIPIEVKDGTGASGHSGGAPVIEDVTETAQYHGPEVRGTVILDDDDDDDKNIPNAPITHLDGQGNEASSRPSAPTVVDVPDYSNDIEEEMIRAAIEASKQDAAMSSQQHDHLTAEKEKALRELEGKVGPSEPVTQKSASPEEMGKFASSNGRQSQLEAGSSSIQDEAEDEEELQLVRHRRRRVTSSSTDTPKDIEGVEVSPTSSPRQNDNIQPQQNGSDFPSDEWGGISSEEHDEAVMLEAAMFGGIPEGTGYNFPYAPHQFMQNGLDRAAGPYPRRAPRPPSPSLTAQRLIREQQVCSANLIGADREKELKAKEEAEAALAEERRREEESVVQLQEERSRRDDGETLLSRMPDGSRRGRRFRKSDKLQYLFDFIDVGRAVKPGSTDCKAYPRRAFSDGESTSTLNELGLTSKQEALYLELI
ncbi:UNVERIFIED_CONTAM: Plant UBX domain-containing protein 8 [Sesamum calycinum]|uniref:Plant UBX domain-containing protein 8 n=1 Tax=Sesamum calycinum TaxID=2727403 RepID=A0AAW2M1Q5_9LAMI